MILEFLFYTTNNIFMMYAMCRKKLELLRKTISNDGQPQENDYYRYEALKFPIKKH
jgi:hypothetical protein